MNNEIRKNILSILAVFTFMITSTLLIYMPNHTNMASALSFLSGVQNFYMEDLSSGVLLKEANPIKDNEGLELDPYTFQVVNKSNKNITYRIILENKVEDESIKLANKYLRYSISTENGNVEVNTLSDDSILLTTTITPNTTQVFYFFDSNYTTKCFTKGIIITVII